MQQLLPIRDINGFISRYSSEINSEDLDAGTIKFLDKIAKTCDEIKDHLKRRIWTHILGKRKESNKEFLRCLLYAFCTYSPSENLEHCIRGNGLDSQLKLNPVHVALITKNKSYLKLFFKYFPNKSDDYGYTFAHFAGIEPHEPVLKVLLKKGVDFFQPNAAGATGYDFLQYRIAHLTSCRDFLTYPFYECPGFNRQSYLMTFKTEYLARSVLTASGLIGMRLSGPKTFAKEESDVLHDHLHRQLLDHWGSEETVPSVYLDRLEVKDDGTPIPEKYHQLEVRARRDFSPGEFIIEYTGLIENRHWVHIPRSQSDKVFQLDIEQQLVNGNKGSNLAQFINCSAPNCGIICIIHQGIPHLVILALRHIKMHESLSYDYRRDHFEQLNIQPIEFAPKALSSFLKILDKFSQMNEAEVVKEIDITGLSPEETIKKLVFNRYFIAMSQYIQNFTVSQNGGIGIRKYP